jgi:hypothetical protein
MVIDRQQKIKMEFFKLLLDPCDMLPEWGLNPLVHDTARDWTYSQAKG